MASFMRIAIVGHHGIIGLHSAYRLIKEEHTVVLIGENIDKTLLQNLSCKHFDVPLVSEKCSEIFRSLRFDIVIFIYGKYEGREAKKTEGPDANNLLDDLDAALALSAGSDVKQFIYISSVSVYGEAAHYREDAVPLPRDTQSIDILAGEKYCEIYGKKKSFAVSILRVSSVYADTLRDSTFINSLVHDVCDDIRTGAEQKDVPDFMRHKSLDFISASDVADAIFRTVSYRAEGIFNISSGVNTGLEDITAQMAESIPGFVITDKHYSVTNSIEQISTLRAQKSIDFACIHNINKDLPAIAESVMRREEKKLKKIKKRTRISLPVRQFAEVSVGFAVSQVISVLTGNLVEFQYIDIRIVFIVITGVVYGLKAGVFASVLTCIAYLGLWMNEGFGFADLFYNINYWLPFIFYIVTGAVTGFVCDKYKSDLEFQKNQNTVLENKYKFIFSLYDDMRVLKDNMQDYLANYKDSFSRIYSITQELSGLHPENIYLSSLKVLTEIMENDTCSIYTIVKGRSFARLSVRSREIAGTIPNSLDLQKVDFVAAPNGEKISIYVNKSLKPGNPGFCITIYDDEDPVLLLMIWKVPYEQYSPYHENLFKTVCSLIGDALMKAYRYFETSSGNLYIEGNFIYAPGAFHDVLEIKEQMKDQNVSDYKLIYIIDKDALLELKEKALKFIRTTDVYGMGRDGRLYLLLAQADAVIALNVINRLKEANVSGELVGQEQILALLRLSN